MLKAAPVRAMFREAFPVESVRLEGRMLAPPIGGRPNLVGAAFDYLLRFRLERGFAGCVVRPWVAEEAVAGINAGMLACDGPAAAEANSRLAGARAAHRDYMVTGIMGDGLIAAADRGDPGAGRAGGPERGHKAGRRRDRRLGHPEHSGAGTGPDIAKARGRAAPGGAHSGPRGHAGCAGIRRHPAPVPGRTAARLRPCSSAGS